MASHKGAVCFKKILILLGSRTAMMFQTNLKLIRFSVQMKFRHWQNDLARFPCSQKFRFYFPKLSVSNGKAVLHEGKYIEPRFQFQTCNVIGRSKKGV